MKGTVVQNQTHHSELRKVNKKYIQYDKMSSLVSDLLLMIKHVDLSLLNTVSLVYFVTSILVFTLLVSGITAPYGRYTRTGWGICINGKVAWFIQEIPSFAVPVIFLFTDAPGLRKTPNILLFGLFCIHYFQR